MPDFQNFSITGLASASVNVPRFRVELQICDSQTGAVLLDYTGANAITFPNDLPTLFPTAAERLDFARDIAHLLVKKKAGL